MTGVKTINGALREGEAYLLAKELHMNLANSHQVKMELFGVTPSLSQLLTSPLLLLIFLWPQKLPTSQTKVGKLVAAQRLKRLWQDPPRNGLPHAENGVVVGISEESARDSRGGR